MRSFRPRPFYFSVEIFSSLLLWFIHVTNPKKNQIISLYLTKTSFCTFSIHCLGHCTYLALQAGDVRPAQLPRCWAQHAQGDRQNDDQTSLHWSWRFWDVVFFFGIRRVMGIPNSEPKRCWSRLVLKGWILLGDGCWSSWEFMSALRVYFCDKEDTWKKHTCSR